ncbi:uncharacterized protein LOC105737221 isoform X2 [Apis florea]|uniref:uncharacterized protein LOC105737221 isoform X2 n=1 Tax=Apis florea TaxID=7463 RepID=UPI0012FE8DF2|nr:uncharacterized protein LOC105737221 isoform X2 [Apis florea]
MKTTNVPKVIRQVQPIGDYDEYQPPNTTPKPKLPKEIEKIRFTTFTLSVQTATIIVISIILVTCCCTLFIKKKFGHLFDRLRGKKKKGKLIMIEEEGGDISRSYFFRKPRRKRKRAPSYEMVHTATQNVTAPTTPKEAEETTKSPGCQRCFKKKRKRTAKRPHR